MKNKEGGTGELLIGGIEMTESDGNTRRLEWWHLRKKDKEMRKGER